MGSQRKDLGEALPPGGIFTKTEKSCTKLFFYDVKYAMIKVYIVDVSHFTEKEN